MISTAIFLNPNCCTDGSAYPQLPEFYEPTISTTTFFSAACPPPSVLSGARPPAQVAHAAFEMLLHYAHKEYSDEYKQNRPMVLLVDDSPTLADYLRAHFFSAWVISPNALRTHWGIQADSAHWPIRKHSMDILYQQPPVNVWSELLPLILSVRKGGFMIIDLQHDSLKYWLQYDEWLLLPFRLNHHLIFQRHGSVWKWERHFSKEIKSSA